MYRISIATSQLLTH